MTALGRKVQMNGQGQMTVTIPKQLAMVFDIEKGMMLYFDTISPGETDLTDLLFVVRKEKK